MPLIYVVEDDDSIREMMDYALSAAGFAVGGFADGGAFFTAMGQLVPDLVLLDIMLPDRNGLALLQDLKMSERYRRLPVIMLTAKGGEMDRVKGLELGADDYVAKPFSVLEVISRVRAVLRRSGYAVNPAGASGAPAEIRVGTVVLNEEKRSVSMGDTTVELTYKEFELLHYLMLNEGIVLSRERLLSQVWGFDYHGESRTVDMHIRALRNKLGAGGALIKTVRSVGYKMGG